MMEKPAYLCLGLAIFADQKTIVRFKPVLTEY